VRSILFGSIALLSVPVLAQQNVATAPSVVEQVAIYEVNRARANPQAYDTEQSLGGVLNGITPAPPLAIHERLVTSSRFHSAEMAQHGYFAHTSAVTGDQPNKMVRNAGYPLKSNFSDNANNLESLAGRRSSASSVSYPPEAAIRALILDQNVNPPGHRYHLLAWGGTQSEINYWRTFREIGTGYAEGIGWDNWNSGAYWTIHTGVRDSNILLLGGVVYNDGNSNGRYDGGEGLGGVTISATTGSTPITTTTNSAGGWSLVVSAGTWTVTCSGGSFSGTRTVQVVITDASRSVDFRSNSNMVDLDFGSWGNLPGSGSVNGVSSSGTPPSFTSAAAPTSVEVGSLYSHTFTATGNPQPTLSASGLPAWLSFDTGTGVLSGTPTVSHLGTTGQITITASNGNSPDATQTFAISVEPIPPAFTSAPPPTTGQVDVLYSHTFSASGTPQPTLSAAGLPSWLSFNATTGLLSGTPGGSNVGTTGMITITADNGHTTKATESFTISVDPQPPAFTSAPPPTVIVAGTLYSHTFTASGNPQPTLSASGLPSWLGFNPGTGVLSGTPGGSHVGVTGQITITADNGHTTKATESFAITVEPSPPAFTSEAPPTTAQAGTTYSHTFTASGLPEPNLSATGLPTWLSFVSGTGVLSGTPTGADVGVSGLITITADNGHTSPAQISFQISVEALPPAFTSAPPPTTGEVDVLYQHVFTASGDPQPTLSAAGLPGWLTFLPQSGVLSGTPSVADVGPSGLITITADNGHPTKAVKTFTITVGSAPPLFVSNPAPTEAQAGLLYAHTFLVSGNPPPVLSASGLPGWLTFNAASGELSGTPGGADVGVTGTITITADNGQPPAASESFVIQVSAQAPVFTSAPPPDTAPVGELYSHTFVASGEPSPLLSASGLPAWLTFNSLTGVLSGTPAPAHVGLYGPMTITADNGHAILATMTFHLTVLADPFAPPPPDQDPTTETRSAFALPGCSASRTSGSYAVWLSLFLALSLACMAHLRTRGRKHWQ
jgi:uncharacterized protein YkwD